ncbi:unnamed protein product [Pseudo-nitzschia multistriata]|uniref:Uncharacterized protein n=1 Tax=Pseudo-nitzschia multistriata TaxID=183589 RepID=A0A448YX15_9STRA|nr:unnamed protein product [Pseudo-nitzschia multistriata]
MAATRTRASAMMLKSMMDSAKMKHLARSHLFLSPQAGLKRNSFWRETMESDVLVYDFQDGCPPGERGNVMKGLHQAHEIYPNTPLSVRVTELERDKKTNEGTSTIYDELSTSLKQKQVYWLMLPMCNDTRDIQEYIDMINHIDEDWLKSHGGLQIICETPLGLHNLDDMLANYPQVKGVIAGSGDYFRFAQCRDDTLLPKFRWEIINACLRHGVFPIDAPPLVLGIEDGAAIDHFQGGANAGYRAGLILHPKQVRLSNEIFSPCPSYLEECERLIDPWLQERETGYVRASGDHFRGPPHLKQMHWSLKYDHQIRGKKTSHIQAVDPDLFADVASLLSKAHRVTDKASENGVTSENETSVERFLNTSMFLALSSSCHDRHEDVLTNLGYFNVEISATEDGTPRSYKEGAFVASQIKGRRLTSAGKLIVTTDVHVLDKDFKTICKMEKRLMEKKLNFDDHAEEGAYTHVDPRATPRYTRFTTEIVRSITDGAVCINEAKDKTVSVDVHDDYCSILNLDAPLHHTHKAVSDSKIKNKEDNLAKPVVPSTLHISHHDIQGIMNEGYDCCRNVTFHSPMRPDEDFTNRKYYVEEIGSLFDRNSSTTTKHESAAMGPGFLSVIWNANGELLSSILLSRNSINDTGSLLIGDSSPVSYTFTETDALNTTNYN